MVDHSLIPSNIYGLLSTARINLFKEAGVIPAHGFRSKIIELSRAPQIPSSYYNIYNKILLHAIVIQRKTNLKPSMSSYTFVLVPLS